MRASEVRLDADGCWYVRPYLGTDASTGRAIRPYHRVADGSATREEAQALADAWLATVAPAQGTDGTLASALDLYVGWLEATGSAANTVASYRTHARRVGRLGRKPVRAVTPADINRLYAALRAPHGGRDGLSGTTMRAFHWFLGGAWKWMKTMRITDANPMPEVKTPKAGRHEALALEPRDLTRFNSELVRLMYAEGTPPLERESAMAMWLSLNTGMRRSEALALRWGDVMWRRRMLHVCGTVVEAGGLHRKTSTKRGGGRNVAVTQAVLEALHDHMERHRAWGPTMPADAVCRLDDRLWMRPTQVSREFRKVADRLGLPREVTLHDLRHTHATTLLEAGVDVKTVSERLGHAKPSTTLDVYAHVLPGRDALAAEAFEQAARAAGGEGRGASGTR